MEGEKFYKRYNPNGDHSLFELTEDEIGRYNELVDKLNADCEWLRDSKGVKTCIDLFADKEFMQKFREHGEAYAEYMTMQENAILRTNGYESEIEK